MKSKQTDVFSPDDLIRKRKIVLQEIFHLLKRTNKFIVCEGVETKEMVDFLVKEGCDELQGYYYYKPMSQEAFEKLLFQLDFLIVTPMCYE